MEHIYKNWKTIQKTKKWKADPGKNPENHGNFWNEKFEKRSKID